MTVPKVIDSAIHLWSTGAEPYPWVNAPPTNLASAATPEVYLKSARAAGVSGALVVQPANHLFDHSYVAAALKDHGDFFRGMCLANPKLATADAVKDLEGLANAGFVGVRFNAGMFEGGLTSEVGRALYKRAGELGMPVGVMAFGGLASFVPALKELCVAYPSTTLIIDHLGFFRQPAIGGQLADAAANDESCWKGLLELAKYPQVYVKVSALFRTSAEPPPFADLQPRLAQLLKAFGAQRLMWGSDYPFVLPGGFPLPEGVVETPAAQSYAQAAQVLRQWSIPELDEEALGAIMGGTASSLFRFDTC
jgi:predicted TIM-barrel fold metal-dependent hydrolase